MHAVLEFDMNNPNDVLDFTIISNGKAYLEALAQIGENLQVMLEREDTIEQAYEMYNEVINKLGIKLNVNEN